MRRLVISVCSVSVLACQGAVSRPGSPPGSNPPLIQDAATTDRGTPRDVGTTDRPDAAAEMDAAMTADAGSTGARDATPLDAFPFADAGPSGSGDASQAPDAGPSTPMEHLLISEVATSQAEAEFIEIWNPGTSVVDLVDYYISDNSAYVNITRGPWSPAGTLGTDFAIGFPSGATLGPDAVLVVAFHRDFEQRFGRCPDYLATGTAALTCGGRMVPLMRLPPNGGQSNEGQSLSNSREMLVLFRWDGVDGSRVRDVDYLTWGVSFDNNTRVDKTSISGYAADTPRNAQDPAAAPTPRGGSGHARGFSARVGGHDSNAWGRAPWV